MGRGLDISARLVIGTNTIVLTDEMTAFVVLLSRPSHLGPNLFVIFILLGFLSLSKVLSNARHP